MLPLKKDQYLIGSEHLGSSAVREHETQEFWLCTKQEKKTENGFIFPEADNHLFVFLIFTYITTAVLFKALYHASHIHSLLCPQQ